jgi:hypothetical protein
LRSRVNRRAATRHALRTSETPQIKPIEYTRQTYTRNR